MKTFNLTGEVTISAYTVVEAETLKEALEIARNRYNMSIIHDGNDSAEEIWMVDELDGEVQVIKEDI